MTFQRISVEQAKSLIESQSPVIFDTRAAQDYQQGHVEGAIHLNEDNINQYLTELNKSDTILVYCYRGKSCQIIAQQFVTAGFSAVHSMDGGYTAWHETYD